MSTFYISAIWQSEGHVTHVIIHSIADNTFSYGQKFTRQQVISLIQGGNNIYTAQWKYDGQHWTKGNAAVGIYPRNGVNYIRTHPDASEKDNLDNLISMPELGY